MCDNGDCQKKFSYEQLDAIQLFGMLCPQCKPGTVRVQIIEQYQPALWVYGHTHQCDDHRIAATRVISNQLGYPDGSGGFECADFDRAGIPVEINP